MFSFQRKKISYSDDFYKERIDSLLSAKEIIPIVLRFINPVSVIDVGCGTGEFLCIFKKFGIKDILGIDGPWLKTEKLRVPKKYFISANLEKAPQINRKFDLVVSLEVAEHLAKKSAKKYVESLVKFGPIILFSAAIPFQGGTNHLNEQWPEYWKKLFGDMGYLPVDCLRSVLWNNKKVSFWYIQNIMFYVEKNYLQRNKRLYKEYVLQDINAPMSLVHPRLFVANIENNTFKSRININRVLSFFKGFLWQSKPI
jgi:SAM-dependent methyltransferase